MVSWLQKFCLFALFMAAYSIFYVYPNFHPLVTPTSLPLLPVDFWFPFMPWTFFIYTSDYLLIGGTIFLLRDAESLYAFVRMMFAALVLSGLCFYLYPTTYPRPPYPVEGSPVLLLLLRMVTVVDQPTNCLPSMHVALSAVATWALRERYPRVCLAFTVWTGLIIFSVLATKQHYFLDVVGGMAVFAFVAMAEKFGYQALAHRYPELWKSVSNRIPRLHF